MRKQDEGRGGTVVGMERGGILLVFVQPFNCPVFYIKLAFEFAVYSKTKELIKEWLNNQEN